MSKDLEKFIAQLRLLQVQHERVHGGNPLLEGVMRAARDDDWRPLKERLEVL